MVMQNNLVPEIVVSTKQDLCCLHFPNVTRVLEGAIRVLRF